MTSVNTFGPPPPTLHHGHRPRVVALGPLRGSISPRGRAGAAGGAAAFVPGHPAALPAGSAGGSFLQVDKPLKKTRTRVSPSLSEEIQFHHADVTSGKHRTSSRRGGSGAPHASVGRFISQSSGPLTPVAARSGSTPPSPQPARNRVSPDAFMDDGTRSLPPARTPPAPSYTETFLIPDARPQYAGKLVVVLDLDESLVCSRDMSVTVRPGTDRLLQVLNGNCELIVWTAGTREYALDVVKMIDPGFAVQHCIYRHPMWWNGEPGCIKDIRMLGRPLDKIVFVDNTPDVFRANPRNAILVSDFECYDPGDRVLSTLADIFEHVFRLFPNPVAADVFASRRIKIRKIPLDSGSQRLELNTVVDDYQLDSRSRSLVASRGGFMRNFRYSW